LEELACFGKRQSIAISLKGGTVMDREGEILTLDEIAAYLKIGKRTVYRLAQKGDIPAFKLGGTWRFRRSELDRWIAEGINKKRREAD
jgi:excisionase family DNA binding protein